MESSKRQIDGRSPVGAARTDAALAPLNEVDAFQLRRATYEKCAATWPHDHRRFRFRSCEQPGRSLAV